MLELFAVRGQLAFTGLVHVTLAATAWTATLLTLQAQRRGDGWTDAAHSLWARARVLGQVSAVSGLLLLVQLGVFWHPTFQAAGTTLWLPVAIAAIASTLRAGLLRTHRLPSGPWTHGSAAQALLLGTVSGTVSLLVLAWLGYPSGATLSPEGAIQASTGALFGSAHGWIRVLHTGLVATMVGAALFAAGAARRNQLRTLRLCLNTALVAVGLQALSGAATVRSIGVHEPVKLAAMAAQWDNVKSAPLRVGGWPYDFGENTSGGLRVPGLLSRWVHADAQVPVEGLLATGMEDRPPVAALYLSAHARLIGGIVLWVMLAVAAIRVRAQRPSRWLLAAGVAPLALVGWGLSWLIAELGRSPWTIRGLLRVGTAAWLPYGMAPSALLWILAATALGVLAVRRCRGIACATEDTEPAPTGNV